MTRKELISLLRPIAKFYGIKAVFTPVVKHCGGFAIVEEDTIYVSTRQKTNIDLACTFFHEIGHVLDYRDGIYWQYYINWTSNFPFNIEIAYLYKYAIKAEVSADRRGEKLMNRHMPGIRFKKAYRDRKDRVFLYKYLGLDLARLPGL